MAEPAILVLDPDPEVRRSAAEILEGSIQERMSKYLVDRIQSTPKIRVRTRATVVGAHGGRALEGITIQNADTGETETVPALFVLIDTQPQTDWLAEMLERDEQGHILCGARRPREDGHPAYCPLERHPYLLETSVPGIFVAGDVRAESVKRVASTREGSMAVQFIHQYLAAR